MQKRVKQFAIHRSFKFGVIGLGLIFVSVVGTLLYNSVQNTDTARADTAPSITNSGNPLYYTITQSDYTSAHSTRVAVYYDSRPVASDRIVIQAPGNSGGANCSGDIRVNVYVGGYSDSNRSLSNTPACGLYSSNNSFSAQNRATYDANVGKYKVLFEVRRQSGDGFFRFQVNSARGIVRSTAAGVMSYETTRPAGDTPTYGRYSLNFGSDCSITSAARRTIVISDPDNHLDSTGAQRGSLFYISLREASRTGSFYDVPGDRYGNLTYVTREGNRNRFIPRIDGGNASFTIDMQPGHRYQLIISNLDHNNTIQVTLPTDEIYHDIPCRWWEDASESRTGVNVTSYGIWDRYSPSGIVTTTNQQVRFAHLTRKLINDSAATLQAHRERYWTSDPANIPATRQNINRDPLVFLLSNPRSFPLYTMPPASDFTSIQSTDFNRPQSYFCERIATRPIGHDEENVNGGWGYSTPACVRLQRSYAITPSVTLGTSSIEEGADTVPGVNAVLTKSGLTPTDPKTYFLSRFVLRPGQPVPSGSVADIPMQNASNLISGWGCYIPSAIAGPTAPCGDVRSDGTPSILTTSQTVFNNNDDISSISGDLTIGDRVCYILGVSRYERQASDPNPLPLNRFRYSAPACVTVSKSPKVQFWGADVLSVNQVVTRGSTIGGAMYGSWAEYGILSPNLVSSASGARLSSGPTGRPVRPTQELNTLTFANIAPNYGNFGATPRSSLPANFTNTVTGTPLTNASIDLSSMDSGEYRRTGNLQISGNVRAGRDIIIKVTGDVTITGNITYDDVPYTSKADMPQLVISANNIIIDESVTEVSAWLIANRDTGYVSTCGQVSGNWLDGLNSSECSDPLKINGPVISNHLYLRRTGGSEVAHRGSPAEILNLRPDTYLWANSSAGSASAISTMKIRELPPRF